MDPRRRLRLLGEVAVAALAVAATAPNARILCAAEHAPAARAEPVPLTSPELAALHAYIERTWPLLTRSLAELPRAAGDPKLGPPAGGRWPVYIAEDERVDAVLQTLRSKLTPADLARLAVRRLPPPSQRGPGFEHGLLYLPRPYVVPGGRFNEMYGWDSFFIVVGLLRSGAVGLARDMVDDFVYEVEHYGTVLNANRTYYLTRSQPPLLSPMVLGVYRLHPDREWLRRSLPAIEAYHEYWLRPPHFLPELGLARYYDAGDGPAPEVLASERDQAGRSHYDRVRARFRSLAAEGRDVARYYDGAHDCLTEAFYDADRAMRESGFDPTGRFGPLGAETLDIAPVDLNALLYGMERDIAQIHAILADPAGARFWEERASRRREAVDRYLWDPARGLYLDYDLRTHSRRDYLFATTFYPLWVGLATPEQADRVVASALPRLETRCGLLTSDTVSGAQWDAPYGWAPLHLFATEGLRRYGHEAAARRLSLDFVALVSKELRARGTILEKYDVERCTSDFGEGPRFGYASNEVGFGWTNGVVLELLADLASPSLD